MNWIIDDPSSPIWKAKATATYRTKQRRPKLSQKALLRTLLLFLIFHVSDCRGIFAFGRRAYGSLPRAITDEFTNDDLIARYHLLD